MIRRRARLGHGTSGPDVPAGGRGVDTAPSYASRGGAASELLPATTKEFPLLLATTAAAPQPSYEGPCYKAPPSGSYQDRNRMPPKHPETRYAGGG
jgi:hypothetical protein